VFTNRESFLFNFPLETLMMCMPVCGLYSCCHLKCARAGRACPFVTRRDSSDDDRACAPFIRLHWLFSKHDTLLMYIRKTRATIGCWLLPSAGLTREEKLRDGALGETHACFHSTPTPGVVQLPTTTLLTLWPYAYFFARNGIAVGSALRVGEREGDRDQSARSVWSRTSDMHDH
jgi:hypothetical protein